MTSIYDTTSRLIGEYLDALLSASWQPDGIESDRDMRVVRLVAAAMALCRQHEVDGKGRCQVCTRRRAVRRRRLRPCTVYAVMNFYLTQPDELVLPQLPERHAHQVQHTSPEAEATVRLPRIPRT